MKINKKILLTSIISGVLSSTITVAAVSLSAKEIGFTSTDSEWLVENVEDAVNDLYKIGIDNSEEIYIAKYFRGGISSYALTAMIGDDIYQNIGASSSENGTISGNYATVTINAANFTFELTALVDIRLRYNTSKNQMYNDEEFTEITLTAGETYNGSFPDKTITGTVFKVLPL